MQSINYAVYDADLEGGEVYFSESLRKMLGMKPDDPAYTTGNIIETIHPDDRPAYREAIVDAFQGQHAALRGRFPLIAAPTAAGAGAASTASRSGVRTGTPIASSARCPTSPRRASATASSRPPRPRQPPPIGSDGSVDAPTTPNEERYALAMESINYGLYDWDLETDAIYFAPNLRILLGLPSAVLKTTDDWRKRIHPADYPLFRRRLIEHLKGETPRLVVEMRYLTEDGTWRWARQHGVAFRGPDGRARRLVGASADITEIKQREWELQSRARPRRNACCRRPRSTPPTPNRATRSRSNRSARTPAPTTPISKPAWSISRLRCRRFSACRNMDRSPPGPTSSIRTTARSTPA